MKSINGGMILVLLLICTTSSTAAELEELFNPILADGFDFPVGNNDGKGSYTCISNGKKYDLWYIAASTGEKYSLGIHTGEDWNGSGGGDTDKGQSVYAIGKGKVVAAEDYGSPWGNVVMLEHIYLENGKQKKVFSLYAHLEEIKVEKYTLVGRRQVIGTIGTGGGAYPAHLHLEIRKESLSEYPVDYWPSSHGKDDKWVLENYEAPTSFISKHRKLVVPAQKEKILVVDKDRYRMEMWEYGKLVKTYEIALSQNPKGHKVEQGDNRLPEGEYHIIQKSRGPFSGFYGKFFGVAWMRLDYPNVYDADEGLKKKLISASERDAIYAAHQKGEEPPKNTRLGGGIGIHGWAGEWKNDGNRNLTWGCITMHNNDLDVLYDLVENGITIIIIP